MRGCDRRSQRMVSPAQVRIAGTLSAKMTSTLGLEQVPPGRQIYSNRTLNLRTIGAIGYDMDFQRLKNRHAYIENQAKVAGEMVPLDNVERRLQDHLNERYGDGELAVAAVPDPKRGERLVVLQPFGDDLDALRVVDAEGRPVPFGVTKRRFLERFWGVDYRAQLHADRR